MGVGLNFLNVVAPEQTKSQKNFIEKPTPLASWHLIKGWDQASMLSRQLQGRRGGGINSGRGGGNACGGEGDDLGWAKYECVHQNEWARI